MGSEIIRGPSYSSEVTLTKFAASIQLCESKQEIKQKLLDFQNEFKVISDEFLLKNLDDKSGMLNLLINSPLLLKYKV